MKLASFGLSDIGTNRPNNEDVWIARPNFRFFAIADGMGGPQAGEIAAKEAINSLCDSVSKIKNYNCMELIIELRCAIEKANQLIYQMGKESQLLLGMGTTLCCLIMRGSSPRGGNRAIFFTHSIMPRCAPCSAF